MIMHISAFNSIGDQKIENLKIQDGGRQLSWKSKNCNISKTVWRIITKFCTMTNIHV